MAQQGFPNWNQPFTDPKTGLITQAWRQFLLTLWERSGGSPGTLDLDTVLLATQGIDRTARAEAQAAMLMALRPVQAMTGAEDAETVYMPLGLPDGRMALAPDGRPIPMVWGTL